MEEEVKKAEKVIIEELRLKPVHKKNEFGEEIFEEIVGYQFPDGHDFMNKINEIISYINDKENENARY